MYVKIHVHILMKAGHKCNTREMGIACPSISLWNVIIPIMWKKETIDFKTGLVVISLSDDPDNEYHQTN